MFFLQIQKPAAMDNSSDCGSESGWTMYFENTCLSPYESKKKKINRGSHYHDDDDDDDMDMVSDASSGPPHLVEDNQEKDEDLYHAPAPPEPIDLGSLKKSGKIIKKKKKNKVFNHCHSLLDDTASSAVLDFSNINNNGSDEKYVDISEGYSGNHFEVRTRCYDYECHSSRLPGKFLQQNQLFEEKRWM